MDDDGIGNGILGEIPGEVGAALSRSSLNAGPGSRSAAATGSAVGDSVDGVKSVENGLVNSGAAAPMAREDDEKSVRQSEREAETKRDDAREDAAEGAALGRNTSTSASTSRPAENGKGEEELRRSETTAAAAAAATTMTTTEAAAVAGLGRSASASGPVARGVGEEELRRSESTTTTEARGSGSRMTTALGPALLLAMGAAAPTVAGATTTAAVAEPKPAAAESKATPKKEKKKSAKKHGVHRKHGRRLVDDDDTGDHLPLRPITSDDEGTGTHSMLAVTVAPPEQQQQQQQQPDQPPAIVITMPADGDVEHAALGGSQNDGNGAGTNLLAVPRPVRYVTTIESETSAAISVRAVEFPSKFASDTNSRDLKTTIWLAYCSIGIIYGDIGTSPLYVFSSTFSSPPSQADVMGVLSLIIWSLTIVVLFKYVIFILSADDHGQGGTFALYSVVARALQARIKDPAKFKKYNTYLSTVALISLAMVISDGMLTPVISVLSAVEGIAVVSPDAYNDAMPITLAILFVLFMVQRFGTAKVSVTFSPVITLWFLSLFCIGVYNVTKAPFVLQAFSPYYAFEYFGRNGYSAWVSLGAVVLCITGTEALYADIGHFSANAVRISFITVAFPSLLMAYCGQAAALVIDPTVISNTFYRSLPDGFLYPMLILATLATIIASQALISAAFSLVMQAMRLQCFPRVTIIHTDRHHEGQIYIPEVNYVLMIGCLLVTVGFQHSANLVVAYGIAVCTVMLIDMSFFSVAIPLVFNKPWPLGVLFFLSYLLVDVSFLSANLLKFVSGGWFPLLMSAIISTMMILWRWGRMTLSERMTAMALHDSELTFTRHPEVFSPVAGGVDDVPEHAPWPLNANEHELELRERLRYAEAHPEDNDDDHQHEKEHHHHSSPEHRPSKEHHLHDEKDAEQGDDPSHDDHRSPSMTLDERPSSPRASSIEHGGDESQASSIRKRPSALRRLTMVREKLAASVPPSLTEPTLEPMPCVPGVFFYFSSTSTLVPAAFVHLIRRIPFRPKLLVFITVSSVNLARVDDGLTISQVGDLDGIHRAVINIGYAQDAPDMAILAARILRRLHYIPPSLNRLHRASIAEDVALGLLPPTAVAPEHDADALAEWASDDAYVAAADPTLLMGRDMVESRSGSHLWHRICVAAFAFLTRISRAQTVALHIPASNLLEVGYRVDM